MQDPVTNFFSAVTVNLLGCHFWIQSIKAPGLGLCLDLCLWGTRDSLAVVSHCKELSGIHPDLCFLSLELKFEHERFLFIKCEKSSGWSFSEWEFLCSWCGFKGDILFLRNLEEEVLQKLDSGRIKNVSSHVTSEISHYFCSVRLMLWCVYVFKLPCGSFPSWGVEARTDSSVWEPRGEALWLSSNPNILSWFGECVYALCVLCALLSSPVMLFPPIFITHCPDGIKFEDMELRNIGLSEVFWKLGN